MYGASALSTAPPPVRKLDAPTLNAALYCTSPTGFVQLADHLRRRDVVFTAEELHREVSQGVAAGLIVHKVVQLNGGPGVDLYALPGYGI